MFPAMIISVKLQTNKKNLKTKDQEYYNKKLIIFTRVSFLLFS